MKWLLAVGGLLLVSAVPAQAQFVGSGGGGGSIGHINFPSLSSPPATQFNAVVVSGTEQDFVPTTYAPYDQVLAQGRTTQAAATPKTLGEVAQEYSREAKPKAKLAFVQDEYGNAIIARAD